MNRLDLNSTAIENAFLSINDQNYASTSHVLRVFGDTFNCIFVSDNSESWFEFKSESDLNLFLLKYS